MPDIDTALHIVTAYSNPMRWESRQRVQTIYENAIIKTPGVHLTTVECQYGDRPFELADSAQINRVRVRAKTICWNKENLLNIGISRLPEGWKYVAWIDGDVLFRKSSWASEAIHALQQYDIIQPWSDAYDLGPRDEHLQAHKSFCSQYWGDKSVVAKGPSWWTFLGGPYIYPHTGYAWCATRQALEWVGGLLEGGMSGAGDHHMALSLVGEAKYSMPGGLMWSYQRNVYQWQQRAVYHINKNIGFLHGTLEHQWHGRKSDRRYVERWDIIIDNKYDLDTDIKKNTYGVTELAGNKPALTHDIDQYFRLRNEDTNTII